MHKEYVHTLGDERLEVYTGLTDAQLRNRLEPEKGIFIAESEKVILRTLEAGYEPVSFLMEEKWLAGLQDAIEQAEARQTACQTTHQATNQTKHQVSHETTSASTPVFIADPATLAALAGYEVTRGALAAFRRPILPTVEEACQGARRIAVLEDITNTVNIGAIFRNAAALGIDAVLLTPGCCDPLYRRALRVSMGNVLSVPWTYIGADVTGKGAHGNVLRSGGWCKTGIPQLREMGFQTVAMALSDKAVSLDDDRLKARERLAIILGTEGEGLSPRTIEACDLVARIPMAHGVDSLNVAAASAIAFWELRLHPCATS